MPASPTNLVPDSATPEWRETQSDRAYSANPPEIIRSRSGAVRGMGVGSLGRNCLQQLVSNPDRLFDSVTTWLKNETNHSVALIRADEIFGGRPGIADSWCCKKIVSRSLWVRTVSQLASLRSTNAFHQGMLMRQLGIATPQPLAIVTVDRDRAYHEYLVAETVPGAVHLRHWASRQGTNISAAELWYERRSIASQLGRQLQRLHQHRFDHRDLKPTNILLCERGNIWIIDLDGVWRWPIMPTHRRVQNLARLWAGLSGLPNISVTDALRFLLHYLRPTEHTQWKSLWRLVARQAEQKIQQRRLREAKYASRQSEGKLGSTQPA